MSYLGLMTLGTVYEMADTKETPTSTVRRDRRWWGPPPNMPPKTFRIPTHAVRATLPDISSLMFATLIN